MQYAEIIINRANLPLLTYKIDPIQLLKIQKYTLVKVPLGNTYQWGIVLDLKKTSGKISKEKLKTIKNIYPDIKFSQVHIDFCNWMAKNFLCSLNESLFSLLPLPISVKKLSSNLFDYESSKHSKHMLNLVTTQKDLESNVLNIIKKTKSNVRLIIPNLEKSDQWKEKIIQKLGIQSLILTSEKNPTSRVKIWQDYLKKSAKVIIGGRNLGLLAPLKDELWLVVDPDNFAYKNDQNPKFHLSNILCYWDQKARIITLNYFNFNCKIKKANFQFLTSNSMTFDPVKTKMVSSNEITKHLSSDILYSNSIIVLPKSEFQNYLYCDNCNSIIFSDCCHKKIILENKKLFCLNCKKISKSDNCLVCKKKSILKQGFLLEKIKKYISRPHTIVSDKDILPERSFDQIIYIGFDFLLDSASIFSIDEYFKIIINSAQRSPKTIIYSNINNPFLSDALSSGKIHSVAKFLHNYAKSIRQNPYFKILKISFNERRNKYYQMILKLIKEKKYLEVISSDSDDIEVKELFIILKTEDWLWLSDLYHKKISNILKKTKPSIDIDPYKIV